MFEVLSESVKSILQMNVSPVNPTLECIPEQSESIYALTTRWNKHKRFQVGSYAYLLVHLHTFYQKRIVGFDIMEFKSFIALTPAGLHTAFLNYFQQNIFGNIFTGIIPLHPDCHSYRNRNQTMFCSSQICTFKHLNSGAETHKETVWYQYCGFLIGNKHLEFGAKVE